MSSSKLFPIFQFSWQPSKQVIVVLLLIYCLALCCLYWSNLPMQIKSLLAFTVSSYTFLEIRKYCRLPKTLFFSNHSNLQCAYQLDDIQDLNKLQWQDWGYIIVLNAQCNGKHTHWLWLMHQLSNLEKRELRLLIRAEQKKVTTHLPSITTNPVL